MQLKVAHHSALLFIVTFVFAAKKGDPCDSKTANQLQFGYEKHQLSLIVLGHSYLEIISIFAHP